MNKKILISLSAFALLAGALTGCGGSKSETGKAVEKASKMTLKELEDASKKEAEEAGEEFKLKVVGLTSVLHTVAESVAEKYEWFNYSYDKDKKVGTGNIDVNNGYKDYALLSALNVASDTYFADYALAQDARSFSTFIEDEITFNFVPSDAKELGMTDETLMPLHGVHFNKLFYTNTNFEKFHPKGLYNIWQVAGWDQQVKDGKVTKEVDHPDHLSKVSFQSPTTEQINMSFLVSCYAEENQARIETAYEHYYGKKWEKSGTYLSAGQQWVEEFIANVSKWHTSDGTAMKETQLSKDWGEGVVYYGAFAKMKDAAGNKFEIDLNGNGTKDDKNVTITCGGKTYTYADESKVCAMDTVKWDWEIDGFNGFMYCMDSQIINKAKYPYSACLFARTLLEQEVYEKAIYNSKNPGEDGKAANQYGYYYPGTESADFRYAKGDWTKKVHMEKEINENYEYLKGVKISTVNNILGLVNSNSKSA